MKEGVKYTVGKTITSVVIAEHQHRTPTRQVFLIFGDDTYLEFYGDDYNCTNNLSDGGLDEVVRFSELNNREIHIFTEKDRR